jgi:predicted MPP superfamily phosphohydrolase
MPLRFIVFLSLALIVYFGLHSLLFLLILKIFRPEGKGLRLGLAILLFSLAACFLTAFFLSRTGSSLSFQWFYYSSALWLGLLINLLLILTAGLLLYGLLQLLSLNPDRRLFGFILMGVAALYTAYGMVHAKQVQIQPISVKIKNIPDQWKGKKAAQITDVHLGLINGVPLADKISELINREKVDLVFITGDLFDGTGDDLPKAVAALDRIQAPIYYIIGNHETYLGLDKVVRTIAGSKIQLLRDKIVDLDGVQIIGADYPARGERKNINSLLEKADPPKPKILLFHVPEQVEAARSHGVALQLAGHTHNGQMWPMKLFTHLIYKDFDYGLHSMGDYSLYTSSGVGTWGPPMRIGSTPEIVIITFK